jgi:hypothetical protein
MPQDYRDDFSPKTIECLAKRASYICSNPSCRCLTLCPSNEDPEKYIYIGKAAHITAASEGGPRYDSSLTKEERGSIDNGIFLCSNCADMIDKNNGLDYPIETLSKWKKDHEEWIKSNLNKSHNSLVTYVEGEFVAKGSGKVTGIKTQRPTVFRPGTKATAEGEGEITGLEIN